MAPSRARSAWTSGAKASVASTLTLKQCSKVHQNTPFSFRKLKTFPPLGASTLAPRVLNPWPPFPKSSIRHWLYCILENPNWKSIISAAYIQACEITNSPWTVTLSWLFTPTLGRFGRILTSKVGHTDIVFGVQSGFISTVVCLCIQDYNFTSLCVQRLRFMPPWLTSTHTHRQTAFDQLIWKTQPAELSKSENYRLVRLQQSSGAYELRGSWPPQYIVGVAICLLYPLWKVLVYIYKFSHMNDLVQSILFINENS